MQLFLSHPGESQGNCVIKEKLFFFFFRREHQIEGQSDKWLKSELTGIKILEWAEEKASVLQRT